MPKKKASKTPSHPVTQYAEKILSGEIAAGRLIHLACKRHLDDLENGHKRGLHFDEERANHVLDFFPTFLRHNEGRYAGEPFALMPWQVFVVGSLFGWLKADGYRRYRHAYIEMPKGSGKTPTASGIALYGLTMDGEFGGEIYCSAVTQKQAEIAFRDCKNMSEKSIFASRLVIGEHNIAFPETNSFIRPISSEKRSLDGKRVYMAIIDEIHEHATPIVVEKMVAGNKGRMQPLNIEITNSGWDRTSVCWSHHEDSRLILEDVNQDDTWFAFIATLDVCVKCLAEGKTQPTDDCADCDHWWEEKNWLKANEALGITVTYDYLRSEVDKALRMPSKALSVKRLNFAIWTESESHWMPLDEWDKCDQPVNLDQLAGRVCYAGLDLADSFDTCSLVLCFPPRDESERYLLSLKVWIPEDMKHRTEKERGRFHVWIKQGLVEATPGSIIDRRSIMQYLVEAKQKFNLREVAIDLWGLRGLDNELAETGGFTVDEKEAQRSQRTLLHGFGQGFASMSEPTKKFLSAVLSGQISHGGNSVFRWMAGNAVAEQDPAGNIKLHKGKSTEKIDGIIAAIMAYEVAILGGADDNDAQFVWSVA